MYIFNKFLISSRSLDLSEKFRTFAFLKTQMVAQAMSLELTRTQYKLGVFAYARRLMQQRKVNGAGLAKDVGSFWKFLESVKCIREGIDDPSGQSLELAYTIHGRILNYLHAVAEEEGATVPDFPSVPTFERV